MVTKADEGLLIHRLVNTKKWDVEDAARWRTEDSNRYNYDIEVPGQKQFDKKPKKD